MGKLLGKTKSHTEVDLDTGEMKRIITDEVAGYASQEPEYIKVYIGTQLCLNNLDPGLAPYILAFAPFMSYANEKHIVRTNDIERQSVAKTLGVSEERIKQIVRKLVDNGIFIPIIKEETINGVVKRTKRRGVYFVNPFFAAKGSWKDIKQLRQQIDFVHGVSSCVIGSDEGTLEIKANIPEKLIEVTDNPYQMHLSDYIRVTGGN